MKPLSIYVHIPFCVKKCGYCDFLSFSGMDAFFDAYTEKLIAEIKLKSKTLNSYEIKTVFIGGGTPTVLKPEQLCRVFSTIKNEFNCAKNMEATIEANPKTVDARSLYMLRSQANRISFGLQSNHNRLLKAIGRIHDKETFDKNFNEARNAGFDNINTDIIFSLPGQSIGDWKNTLDYIIRKNPEHISAYGLILEEHTALYDEVQKGVCCLPDEETYLDMYYMAKKKLKDAGYTQYEISNFAKPGYKCKHNTVYWRCMEYVGFGIGASSYIDSFRFRNECDPGKYLTGDCLLRYEVEKIGVKDAMSEFMFMGLRMTEGIFVNTFLKQFGVSVNAVYGEVLASLIKEGLIKQGNDRVCLTDKGIDVSNYVFSRFLF